MNSHIKSNMRGIIVAPNGAVKTRRDHPSLPMTLSSMVTTAKSCVKEGAAMLHVHVRDAFGQHMLDPSENAKWYETLKLELGNEMIVQMTTEAVGRYSPKQQIAMVDKVEPEAVSIALRELRPELHQWQAFDGFISRQHQRETLTQWILYSAEEVDEFIQLVVKQRIPIKNQHVLIVLGKSHAGNKATIWNADVCDLLAFEERIDQLRATNLKVSICAFGPNETSCLIHAMQMGCDIRVGFENNLCAINGKTAKNNAKQVRTIKKISKLLNISFHDAYSFRAKLT